MEAGGAQAANLLFSPGTRDAGARVAVVDEAVQ
jgi:hypothetical protein